MLTAEDFGNFETAWCPGCGNHSILKAVKKALARSGIRPHESIFVSGIGQAAKTPHYLKTNVFNGLHGRALAAATGIRLANPKANIVVESGDGCSYGEGGNHFLAAIRRNVTLTMLVHDNQIYGLTKGQASPTTTLGQTTKAQPRGNPSESFNPVALAVAMKANFVARSFSGLPEHLEEMIVQAMKQPGFSLVDIMQPCVSFNKINTFAWYKERCYHPDGHDPRNWEKAMNLAAVWGERIPVGIIYRGDRQPFEQRLPHPTGDLLYGSRPAKDKLREVMDSYA
ncbi:MAG: 2-oxoacid:ferredoxin oxidoreductase subunit beta [Desulfonatronovibrionaceae bacterium]